MSAKSTWMSGGSGSGVYDPVTTGDNVRVQLNDQDDGWLRFKGGRKYNFGTYRNSGLKGLCDDIRSRSRPRCLFIGFISTVLLILLIAIIAIAASRDKQPQPGYAKWTVKSIGLNFRPSGHMGTVFLPFSVQKDSSYLNYTNQLNAAVEPYKTIHIHKGETMLCNRTNNPADKICQQPLSDFGANCFHTHRYGYSAGQPCILLTFTVPKDYTARGLLPKDGEVHRRAEKVLGRRYSEENIGISCEPATAEDKKYIGNTSALGDAIDYNPPTGFPNYFFRPRSVDKFVPPGVMVQFRSIRDSLREPHLVKLVCTAWGKVLDPQGKAVNEDMYTSSFIFRIH